MSNPRWNSYYRRMKRLGAEPVEDERFTPYFRTRQRIKVRLPGGEVVTGTVHAGDGGLVLRKRFNSRGDDIPLNESVELLAELVADIYREIKQEKED